MQIRNILVDLEPRYLEATVVFGVVAVLLHLTAVVADILGGFLRLQHLLHCLPILDISLCLHHQLHPCSVSASHI